MEPGTLFVGAALGVGQQVSMLTDATTFATQEVTPTFAFGAEYVFATGRSLVVDAIVAPRDAGLASARAGVRQRLTGRGVAWSPFVGIGGELGQLRADDLSHAVENPWAAGVALEGGLDFFLTAHVSVGARLRTDVMMTLEGGSHVYTLSHIAAALHSRF